MGSNTSKDVFALIDIDGNRRIPKKIQARDGRYGYAIHPSGKGNDASAATYTEDEKDLVQGVVLRGQGVRTTTEDGPYAGQTNTLGLSGKKIVGYWLCPSKLDWVAGARNRPVNEEPQPA